ncbi:hypothetical protein KP509_39G010000 [Ceratopteris richardii]|nr:hypothetical protein KP509_39G010000 [Ceratopteris richardii]
MSNGGGFLSTSLTSGIGGRSCSLLPERSPYVTDGPWIDEGRSNLIDRGFHLSEQVHAPNIQSSQHSPSQPHGSAVPPSGQTRPRPRARRGQATDPHSIAERKRREKIANAMKELQELVPVLNKADRIAFVDGVIEYVKFLQLQTKVFFMSRLGTTGASLVADASQVQNGIEAMVLSEHMDMVSAEEEIAQLLEQDIGKALQELQSKGLCIMPISLAAILRIHDKQSLGLQNSAL